MINKLSSDENTPADAQKHIEENLDEDKYKELLNKTMNFYKSSDKIIEFEVGKDI